MFFLLRLTDGLLKLGVLRFAKFRKVASEVVQIVLVDLGAPRVLKVPHIVVESITAARLHIDFLNLVHTHVSHRFTFSQTYNTWPMGEAGEFDPDELVYLEGCQGVVLAVITLFTNTRSSWKSIGAGSPSLVLWFWLCCIRVRVCAAHHF